jgi:hypothetical protein
MGFAIGAASEAFTQVGMRKKQAQFMTALMQLGYVAMQNDDNQAMLMQLGLLASLSVFESLFAPKNTLLTLYKPVLFMLSAFRQDNVLLGCVLLVASAALSSLSFSFGEKAVRSTAQCVRLGPKIKAR